MSVTGGAGGNRGGVRCLPGIRFHAVLALSGQVLKACGTARRVRKAVDESV